MADLGCIGRWSAVLDRNLTKFGLVPLSLVTSHISLNEFILLLPYLE